MKTKNWYDYLWIVSIIYFSLGFFNILFAWTGLIFLFSPLIISLIWGNKSYCNFYCERSKLLNLIGNKFKFSKNKTMPKFLTSKIFRYSFFIFFMLMFANMIFFTFLVFKESENFSSFIKLFWSLKVPWEQHYDFVTYPNWIYQFALGFYSMMLTSTIIGIILSIFYKSRSWCAICPIGTMTQEICKLKNKK